MVQAVRAEEVEAEGAGMTSLRAQVLLEEVVVVVVRGALQGAQATLEVPLSQ